MIFISKIWTGVSNLSNLLVKTTFIYEKLMISVAAFLFHSKSYPFVVWKRTNDVENIRVVSKKKHTENSFEGFHSSPQFEHFLLPFANVRKHTARKKIWKMEANEKFIFLYTSTFTLFVIHLSVSDFCFHVY